jgi:heat shock protein HslJ
MMMLHLLAAVAAQTPNYEASGFEPGWRLVIGGGRMTLEWTEGPPVSVRTPRRRAEANGYRYVTRRFIVRVVHEPCEDEAERIYADTVTVFAGDLRFEGCGGEEPPPPMVANTSWDIVGIGIDLDAVSGENYRLEFGNERLTAVAGCNRLSASFTEADQVVTAGPVASTRMACRGPAAAHERSLLRVLGAPMRIMAWEDGGMLVLVNEAGQIQARRRN